MNKTPMQNPKNQNSQGKDCKSIQNHTQDIASLETEVDKLEYLFVIDLDSFEEFFQKNCPILYDLAHTYALLKELEDITNKKE